MTKEENFIIGKGGVMLDKIHFKKTKNKMFKRQLEQYKQQLENKK